MNPIALCVVPVGVPVWKTQIHGTARLGRSPEHKTVAAASALPAGQDEIAALLGLSMEAVRALDADIQDRDNPERVRPITEHVYVEGLTDQVQPKSTSLPITPGVHAGWGNWSIIPGCQPPGVSDLDVSVIEQKIAHDREGEFFQLVTIDNRDVEQFYLADAQLCLEHGGDGWRLGLWVDAEPRADLSEAVRRMVDASQQALVDADTLNANAAEVYLRAAVEATIRRTKPPGKAIPLYPNRIRETVSELLTSSREFVVIVAPWVSRSTPKWIVGALDSLPARGVRVTLAAGARQRDLNERKRQIPDKHLVRLGDTQLIDWSRATILVADGERAIISTHHFLTAGADIEKPHDLRFQPQQMELVEGSAEAGLIAREITERLSTS